MGRLARIRVYPIKALDAVERDRAHLTTGGTLEHDREFAMFGPDGDVINGKRTAAVHTIAPTFDLSHAQSSVTVDDRRFDLAAERPALGRWLGEYVEMDVTVRRDRETGFVDRRDLGPSVVSTATIETVASWFDELTVESVRRRLRANLEIAGVPPFWEDRFVGDSAPGFRIGDVHFEGARPCGRCVVPERDPDSGEPLPTFREQFVRKRAETFPDFANTEAFDHYYAVMLITRVPTSSRGARVHVGDSVEVIGSDDTILTRDPGL